MLQEVELNCIFNNLGQTLSSGREGRSSIPPWRLPFNMAKHFGRRLMVISSLYTVQLLKSINIYNDNWHVCSWSIFSFVRKKKSVWILQRRHATINSHKWQNELCTKCFDKNNFSQNQGAFRSIVTAVLKCYIFKELILKNMAAWAWVSGLHHDSLISFLGSFTEYTC